MALECLADRRESDWGGSKRGNNGGVDMGDRRIRRVTLRFGGEFYYYVPVEQYQEQENLLLMVVM